MQISYIGMQTQEVAIKPNLKVVLKPDTEVLDEVVVVAYGTASRQSITGAVASIDSKKLEMRPVTEVTGTLEGAAPGIQVNNSYGEPGSDKSEIRIRGFGSVNGTNAPLIVVDAAPPWVRFNNPSISIALMSFLIVTSEQPNSLLRSVTFTLPFLSSSFNISFLRSSMAASPQLSS